MKILRERINKHGKREVVVELNADEHIQAIKEDAFYKTGYPQEEVVQGHIILDSVQVTWCSIGQEWVS
jgi:hypothetical protein